MYKHNILALLWAHYKFNFPNNKILCFCTARNKAYSIEAPQTRCKIMIFHNQGHWAVTKILNFLTPQITVAPTTRSAPKKDGFYHVAISSQACQMYHTIIRQS
jgi:hypothetical protein